LSALEFRPIRSTETHQLRHQILRPHQPLSECAYPYDDAPEARHIGCFSDGHLVGVGSMVPEAREDTTVPTSWRIRGMAVLQEMRGSGAGGKILQALIDYASTQSVPAEIWCNGRSHVKGFYEHFGFVQHGDLFDLPQIGPHVLLIKTLPGNS
jgi:predicted GNAT family N-acyltransferase